MGHISRYMNKVGKEGRTSQRLQWKFLKSKLSAHWEGPRCWSCWSCTMHEHSIWSSLNEKHEVERNIVPNVTIGRANALNIQRQREMPLQTKPFVIWRTIIIRTPGNTTKETEDTSDCKPFCFGSSKKSTDLSTSKDFKKARVLRAVSYGANSALHYEPYRFCTSLFIRIKYPDIFQSVLQDYRLRDKSAYTWPTGFNVDPRIHIYI